MTKILSSITGGISKYKKREVWMRQSAELDPTNEDKKLILDSFRKDGRKELAETLQDVDVKALIDWERATNRKERQKTIRLTKQEVRAATKVEQWVSFMDQCSQYPGGWYEKLSDTQKELVGKISIKNPNAIKEISETAITVVAERGEFELPLQDSIIASGYEHSNIPQSFLDKKKYLWLRDCIYYTGKQLKQYYEDVNQDLLSKADIESIVALMPSWDKYSYSNWWLPMRQLMTLIGMTDQDFTSRADSRGDAGSDGLAEYGYVWLGAKGDDDNLLRSKFYSDKASLYRNDLENAFRLRLFKKLSS